MADNTKVVTGEVRFSYANLFKPKTNDTGTEVWSVLLLIPKADRATLAKLKAAAEQALKDGIEDGKLRAGTSLKNAWKSLKDGDERDDLDEKPEYAGMYYMNVNAYNRAPGVIGPDKQEIINPSELYSGCWGRVSLNARAFNKDANKGITFYLNNVMKTRDDDALGGASRARAEDDFADVEVELGGGDDDLFGDDSVL